MTTIRAVPVDDLQQELGFDEPIAFAAEWRRRPLRDWVMEADGDILRYVFRNFRPARHLEFGTWQGDGVLRCVEECDATVWTLNVLEGESRANGEWAYATQADDAPLRRTQGAQTFATDAGLWVRTDAYGQIGRKYLDAGFGKRVCQIYCDSREWDTHHFPRGFFDTVFIDGGHGYDTVKNDTWHAIDLARPGGLIMWHDFCPLPDVTAACESTRDVVGFLETEHKSLLPFVDKLFWIDPSWILIGVRSRQLARNPHATTS
jgi:predicted O-methyltransferase YrrM